MTTADTIMLRERLVRELRDADAPLSTDELAARMPWKVEITSTPCELLCQARELPAGLRIRECHRSWHVVEYQRTTQGFAGIYRHLRSLERQGLIRRHKVAGLRRVFWIYQVGDQRSNEPVTNRK
ncbi:hypothetical protein JNN96_31085 [Mycobacterium sp. DSM 3803]|nr:hypothetical protein [Mycobacterium sp. DSM 3803]OKH65477.1 hypothetical protein EB73_21805 [Mycobacterium sp. SWH-M3]